jgi:nitrogen fixation/metabolism regulation signal transduction histidine kinase
MAKRIVEGHGGSITLANGSSGGAVVSIEIPLRGGVGSLEEV